MLNEIRGSLRSRVVDSNNNVLSDNDRASIELEDGTKIVVGDIAWIKNHKCLDTLVIVQNIYDDARVELRNLIDDSLLVLIGKTHLTSNCKTLMDSIFESGFGTLALFREYQCRNLIEQLTTAIKSAEKRLKFCAETLPIIFDEAKNLDWRESRIAMISQRLSQRVLKTDTEEESKFFKEILIKLFYYLKHGQVVVSDEEKASIAEMMVRDKREIPFVLSSSEKVCKQCLQPGNLITCAGSCNHSFHNKCINKPTATNWKFKKLDTSKRTEIARSSRHTTDSLTNKTCMECKNQRGAGRPNHDENNNNNASICTKCKEPFIENDKIIACMGCSGSFHATAACIPAGALLLSETQLVCDRKHSSTKISEIAFKSCSVCHTSIRSSKSCVKCTKCPSKFHKTCRWQSECIDCAGNTPRDIVYMYSSKKWWPAIIISNKQVPENIYKTRKEDPGLIYVYTIGKWDYEQVQASDLLTFRIEEKLRDVIMKINDDSLKNAIKITKKVNDRLAR